MNKQGIYKRNISLDLLRIISMIMIIMLHIGSHGGILLKTKGNMALHCVQLFIEALCIVSINVFVLISAYFLVDQNFRIGKMIRIILEVWFYSWMILLLCRMLGFDVNVRQAVFPISFSQNWFATAYIGLYLIFPILNIVIKNIGKRQLQVIIILLCIMLGIWSDVIPSSNPFGANPGASTVWFIVLYFIGAYIKKYPIAICTKTCWGGYIVCTVLLVFAQLLMIKVGNKFPVLSILSEDMYYYRYNSIFVVLASIALFVGFTEIHLREQSMLGKLVLFFQPLCFGVYLIHDNPNLRTLIWCSIFKTNTWESIWDIFLKEIIVALIIFIVCSCIDYIRNKIFIFIEKSSWYSKFILRMERNLQYF